MEFTNWEFLSKCTKQIFSKYIKIMLKKLFILSMVLLLFSFFTFAQNDNNNELNKYSIEVLENTQRYLDFEGESPIVLLDFIWPENEKVIAAFDEFTALKKSKYCLYWKEKNNEHLLVSNSDFFVYFFYVDNNKVLFRTTITKEISDYLQNETFVDMGEIRTEYFFTLIKFHKNGKKNRIGNAIVEPFSTINGLKVTEYEKGFIKKNDIPRNVINYIERWFFKSR